MRSATCFLVITMTAFAASDYPIQPVPFTDVHFGDAFWSPRLETNRTVTLPSNFEKCEETGRISNFAKAGGLMEGDFEGIYFNDSDVFKIVEGAAYTLALEDNPELEEYLDDLIAKFAAAQEEDGYLYTARTIDPENPAPGAGKERWSNIQNAHELYNIGHMYEAAVAHYQATGKRTLLDVALKSADLVARVFGPDGRHDPPGHEEIEIGLTKLYRVTGDRKYLDLARFFIDQRGHANDRELYGVHYQDHKPVLDQHEAEGHAVRAGYLYSGMADIAALTENKDYIDAIGTLWEDVVNHKIYLTGGIGARRQGEAFGDAYELPNKTAYNETCAAIANCLWNHRLFLLHGDGKYMDVFERTLYNGFLAGVSFEGDTFFYPNPLEADGVYAFNQGAIGRSPWFATSCCPSNVVRFMPSLPGYVYAVREDSVYVNLYVAGKGTLPGGLTLTQQTRYPWDGAVTIGVDVAAPVEKTLRLRIPGWALGDPLPGDLYQYVDDTHAEPVLKVNGESVPLTMDQGYAVVSRTWEDGDRIELAFDMPIRRVVCDERVTANRGRVALERGPIVYCVEGVDHEDALISLYLEDDVTLWTTKRADLLNGVTTIDGRIGAIQYKPEEDVYRSGKTRLSAIPYYAWAHRGAGAMTVWLARSDERAQTPPKPTLASEARIEASHVHEGDTVSALNDQTLPEHSNDHGVPRFTWWDHKGGKEWVQYEWPEPVTLSATEVYWFDDTGSGQCRVPASWRVLYRDGDHWRRVEATDSYDTRTNRFNRVTFEPVTTTAVRIEARLEEGFSAGVLEWVVE
jgi:hypothetical protein